MKNKLFLLAVPAFFLSGCTELGQGNGQNNFLASGTRSNFQQKYSSARADLEGGNYRSATRKFRNLEKSYSGSQLGMRLRLELAHALLRSGAYDEASQQASLVAQSTSGSPRGMALAVLGTAKHEIGLAKSASGHSSDADLRAAAAALQDMLTNHPNLDAGGAMARRVMMINASLGQ